MLVTYSPKKISETSPPHNTRLHARSSSVHVELGYDHKARLVGAGRSQTHSIPLSQVEIDFRSSPQPELSSDSDRSVSLFKGFQATVASGSTHPATSTGISEPFSISSDNDSKAEEENRTLLDNMIIRVPTIERRDIENSSQSSRASSPEPEVLNINNQTPPPSDGDLIVNSPVNEIAMAGEFSAKDLSDLIPKFNGNYEGLDAYIGTVSMLETEVKQADKKLFLLMIKAKLSGKADDAIKFVVELDSWEKVKQALTSNIAPPMNAATAQNKLIRAQQRNDKSVRDFSDFKKNSPLRKTLDYYRDILDVDYAIGGRKLKMGHTRREQTNR